MIFEVLEEPENAESKLTVEGFTEIKWWIFIVGDIVFGNG